MNQKPIPVTILAGFLGAGKTTLLNHILTNANGMKLAVIVNDFGSINVDAELIKSQTDNVISLENGCVCCNLAEGLVVSVMRLLALKDRPDHIIVETSGIAEPKEVAMQFEDPELQAHAPLNAIITTIDSENVLSLDGSMAELSQQQIQVADIVLVNKVDLVDSAELEKVKGWCRVQAPFAKLVDVTFGKVELPILFDTNHDLAFKQPNDEQEAEHTHCHDDGCTHEDCHHSSSIQHDFETFSFETHTPLVLETLFPVLQQFSIDAYRMKGILNLAERSEHRCIFQCTGQRANVTVGEAWQEGEERVSRLVFIGPKGGLDTAMMQDKLNSLIA
ncbi:GTP-binding protein [Vibrio sp. FNV 38]|nr:GTP-binding protein [Vibrio sp. FNV 38]